MGGWLTFKAPSLHHTLEAFATPVGEREDHSYTQLKKMQVIYRALYLPDL